MEEGFYLLAKKVSNVYTLQYKNPDYKWWNPFHWLNRTYVQKEGGMTPIIFNYRRKSVFVTSDSIGHYLVEVCSNLKV